MVSLLNDTLRCRKLAIVEQARAHLANLMNVYLAVGSDDVKIKRAAARLRTYLLDAYAFFNYNEYDAQQLGDISEVLSCCMAMPMGDDVRIVVLFNVDALARDMLSQLVSYVQNPNTHCVLFLSATKMAKNTALYKAVAHVGQKAIIPCAAAQKEEVPVFVERVARSKNLQFDANAIAELIGRVGAQPRMLTCQIEMIAAHMYARQASRSTVSATAAAGAGAGKGAGTTGAGAPAFLRVTREDVCALVDSTAEVTPWKFLDALSARNKAQVLAAYAQLKSTSSPIQLARLMVQRIRALMCARACTARGDAGHILSALHIQAWQQKRYSAWARLFAQGELEELLLAGVALDAQLKSSQASDTALLELIRVMCTRARS